MWLQERSPNSQPFSLDASLFYREIEVVVYCDVDDDVSLVTRSPTARVQTTPGHTPLGTHTHTLTRTHTHTHTPRLERVRGGAAHRRCRPGKVGHAAGEPEALGGRVVEKRGHVRVDDGGGVGRQVVAAEARGF